ncbi:MAG: hypothetical protein PHW04_11510 [Candidatus Wallbacteria bacterium]|nr:hypothetical protein [Candidatus Wallbacteria bacterium]
MKKISAILLNIFLYTFALDAVISLSDSALCFIGQLQTLQQIRIVTTFIAALEILLLYLVLCVTCVFPLKLIVPQILFLFLSTIVQLPAAFIASAELPKLDLFFSLAQFLIGWNSLRILRKSNLNQS